MAIKTDKKETKETKTLTFGLGQVYGWDIKKKKPIALSDDQRISVYDTLRAGSRVLAFTINVLNAGEFARRVKKIPEKFEALFKPNYLYIKNDLVYLGMKDIEDISGSALSQTWSLGMKPDFAGQHGKELLFIGTRGLPVHRIDGTHPFLSRGNETKIIRFENRHFLVICPFSKVWADRNKLPNGWIAFPVKVKSRDHTMLKQLDKVVSGEWELKNSRLQKNTCKKGQRWLGQVVVSYIPEPFQKLDPNNVMGVDPGFNRPVTIHIRKNGKAETWAMGIGRGKEMTHVRQMIRSEIVRILRALRCKDSPLDKQSKKILKNKLRELRKRERRVVKTGSQIIAARLAYIVKRYGIGVLQIEDLTPEVKDDSVWLRKWWAPGEVKNAIIWQMKQLGVEIKYIDPAYTSQRCNHCGHVSKENRKKGKNKWCEFECVNCGHKDDADKNAARNLSLPNIESILSSYKASLTIKQKSARMGKINKKSA